MAEIGTDIEKARAYLEAGQLVAIPTETVYGLAANALNPGAVAQIFAVKQRPHFDPLIVHTDRLEKAMQWIAAIPAPLQQLAEAFMPGPLTLVVPKKDIIPDIVTAGLPTVGLRIPSHPLTRRLLASLNFPVAAPSANPFGYVSPTNARHVEAQLGEHIPYILDGGSSQIGLESTIVAWNEETQKPIVLRLGGIPLEEIEKVAGKVMLQTHSSSNPKAPGMLSAHYAPRKKVFLSLEAALRIYSPQELGAIVFKEPLAVLPVANQLLLSPQGNYTEAAQRLFAALREIEELPVKAVVAPLLPEEHLGRAINDRLRRAAASA
ncbi:L-threonylcarbamoyladenylate synthase [Thermonema rossianum]|uniref:L-threonylcarbamoyladenylate synthase n=1 Tax=Thermonema rossianum TaxID=55505 RepID=UPI0005702EA2|nr:L-threonylcarbamoyladenylate synthase [Thermonema rossianum]